MAERYFLMLDWPEEILIPGSDHPKWQHAGSNLLLDFHGDPTAAKLVVFSDGNHHMALMETLQCFLEKNPAAQDIFYATTPPSPVLKLLKHGSLQIGNFILSVAPHVFISPPHVLEKLVREGYMHRHVAFMRNRGNVLLVKNGNPKRIKAVADLMREDVHLFLSNPQTETVSYKGYVETIKNITAGEGIESALLSDKFAGKSVVFGDSIHHREAPQAIADGDADAAILYYHLALRYTRIFPGLFEIVPLGGTAEDPQPSPQNVVGLTHVGMIGDGGEWGSQLIEFLLSDAVGEIYKHHGLLPLA
jgi:hypothetical protein